MKPHNLYNYPLKFILDPKSKAFDDIYIDHFPALYRYAYTILHERELAEEMVHQVFLKIIERKKPVELSTSVKAYLFRAVNNECLNHIKHQKVKQRYQSFAVNDIHSAGAETPSSKLAYKELERHLQAAINTLPERCRTIFQLSRFEELKYAEIADALGISVKTVENQMSKALRKLRLDLADYLPLILWLLIMELGGN